MRTIFAGTLVMLAMAATGSVHAQAPVTLELRGGAALPTDDLGDVALNPGAGAGLTVGYDFMPHLGAYVGWDWFRMTSDEAAGESFDVENTGYAFGLRFQHPLMSQVGYWVRAGGLYAHIELEDDSDITVDSGHELGWEAGAGLRLPVGDRFMLTPGLRYRMLPTDLMNPSVDLAYIAIEMGVQYRLGK